MRFFYCLLICLSISPAFAQQNANPAQRAQRRATITQQGEPLNLQQAVMIALDKNYQIRIARSQEQTARNDNSFGNAGFLPTVTGNLNNNSSSQHLRQSYLVPGQDPTDRPGVISRTTTTGINATWQLFNGFATFYVFEQLNELVRISEVTTRANIEQTIANVATGYYDVIRQLQQLLSLRQALDISRDRLELARATFEVGTRSKVDYLSAQVDYNADSSALISQEQTVSNAKILLNTLLLREPLTEFAIHDTILIRPDLNISQLQESLLNKNPQLVAATLNRRVANLNLKIVKSRQYPTVTVQAGYNYTNVNNQGGTGIRTADNNGFTYGLQAAVPIFGGFNQRRLTQDARVNTVISEYQEADQRVQLQSALNQTFSQYQSNLRLVNLEVQNYQIALQNIDIAYDRYRVGFSTAVEFRDVQRNAVAAQARLIDAEYNAKAAEIELFRLSSTITQEIQ